MPEVVVHLDQPAGRFTPGRYANASCEALYGEVVSNLGDPMLAWLRALNCVNYVRCYNWLGDGIPQRRREWFSGCRVLRSGPGGQPVYQWEGLERVIDPLLAAGVKPFIVCGGVPDALAQGPIRRNESGAPANRPADEARYQDLIAQMVRRLEKTYGPEEVRTWYFEVWSQPDHEGSWEGGRPAPFDGEVSEAAVAPFNRLYDHFVAGVNAVDPKVRVGGPGLAGDRSFLRRFLEHCARGANATTGKPGTRLDFVSWNHYGTVPETLRGCAEIRALLEKDYPELKGAQLVLSESGAPASDPRANDAAEAARLAALVDGDTRTTGGGTDLIFRAGDLADSHFDGFRPLVTRLGPNTLPTPALRMFSLLYRMGDERLKVEAPAGVGAIAAHRTSKDEKNTSQVLVYRYDPDPAAKGEPVTVKIRVSGMQSGLLRYPVRTYRIDASLNAPYESWLAAGKPSPAPASLPKEIGVDIQPNGVVENVDQPVTNGEAAFEVKLAPNSVVLATLGAEPVTGEKESPRVKRLRKAEEEFAVAADLVRQGNAPKAVDQLRKIASRYSDTYWRESALQALVALYEVDVKSPADAAAARKELLALPLDPFTRLGVLTQLRVAAVRARDSAAVTDLTAQINALERELNDKRQWPLHRLAP